MRVQGKLIKSQALTGRISQSQTPQSPVMSVNSDKKSPIFQVMTPDSVECFLQEVIPKARKSCIEYSVKENAT